MVRRYIQWMAVASKKVVDAYEVKNYTWRMVMVPKPRMESPLPCILVSLSNGHDKILLRFSSLEAYNQAFKLTSEDEKKIGQALEEANQEANRIEADIKLLFQKRHLTPGSQIVNTGTGEVLAEAERIIEESRRGEGSSND